eukprot:5183975-Amphidinium_carterae.1
MLTAFLYTDWKLGIEFPDLVCCVLVLNVIDEDDCHRLCAIVHDVFNVHIVDAELPCDLPMYKMLKVGRVDCVH